MRKFKTLFILTFVFILSVIGSSALFSYSYSEVKLVYKFLKKKFLYADASGKFIRVKSMGYSCSGSNCNIKVNGQTLKLETVHRIQGKRILQVLTGKEVATISNKKLIESGLNPTNTKGIEKGVLKGITQAHNYYRKKTGVANLVYDHKIAIYAQRWANYLKRNNRCNMKHRTGRNRVKNFGENLAWASGKQLNSFNVVKLWFDEIKDYNYGSNRCKSGAVCGHYTQVIWKTSKRLGCGVARCANSEVWVCSYDPPGNYRGRKPY